MEKNGIWMVAAIIIGFCFLLYNVVDRYELGKDEIAIHIQFDTKEDIGLLIYDYCVNGHKYSGGRDYTFVYVKEKNICKIK